MLGREITRAAVRMAGGVDWRVAAFTEEDLDVTDPEAVQSALSMASPAVVINCAAYTNVDGAETNEEAARYVNAEAPGRLARACLQADAALLHFSTDYVFDGASERPYREDDPVRPLGVYGRTKLAGEVAIRASGAPYLILRTQWLYGRGGKNFVDTILAMAEAGETPRVVSDQHGAPTYARDLAAAALTAVAKQLRGIYHAANAGACTWYDVARAALRFAGHDPDRVKPVLTTAFPRPAPRPAYGVLDTSRLAQAGITLRRWEEALEAYIRKDWSGSGR
jgi:dTDP-4-dehydrorhamnose reductase